MVAWYLSSNEANTASLSVVGASSFTSPLGSFLAFLLDRDLDLDFLLRFVFLMGASRSTSTGSGARSSKAALNVGGS